jgi:aspartate racemase
MRSGALEAIAKRGFNRIGILGTRTVMETRFYDGVTSTEIIPPSGQDMLDVHQAYVTMAVSGVVTDAAISLQCGQPGVDPGEGRSSDHARGD